MASFLKWLVGLVVLLVVIVAAVNYKKIIAGLSKAFAVVFKKTASAPAGALADGPKTDDKVPNFDIGSKKSTTWTREPGETVKTVKATRI